MLILSRIPQLLPPLRIHCWGGFGSQLNALSFALELKMRIKNRQFVLVFHTAGLTRRNLEISELIPDFIRFEIVDDFVSDRLLSKNIRKSRRVTSRVLSSMQIIVTPSTNSDFSKIKVWTLSSRGHYSHIRFSKRVLTELGKTLELFENCEDAASLVIHYRLGDLLEIEKGYIQSEQILQIAKNFNKEDSWLVLTDSPIEARAKLADNTHGVIFDAFECVDPKKVLRHGFSSDIFIGTTSKLSIWVAIFRIHGNRGLTYLPRSMREEILTVISHVNSSNLRFFP